MTMSDAHLRDSRGNRYSTPELAQAATRQNEADDAQREARAKAAADAWEADLQRRYLATPGATEADWQRDRADVIASARKSAALAADDAARDLNARRYAV